MHSSNNGVVRADIDRLTIWLVSSAAAIIGASTVSVAIHRLVATDHWFTRKVMKLFYLDLELNVPTFFSAGLLVLAAALLAVIFLIKRQNRESNMFHWAALACGFVLMAFDELIAAHEKLIEPMRLMIGEGELGVLYFAWVIPAICGVAIIGLGFLKFFINLPGRTRFLFGASATLFLGGALGFEFVEGWHVEANSKETGIYFLLTTVEETLEIFGVILFIRALLEYLTERTPMIAVLLEKGTPVQSGAIEAMLPPQKDVLVHSLRSKTT